MYFRHLDDPTKTESDDDFPKELANLVTELEQSDSVSESSLENGDLIGLRRSEGKNGILQVGEYRDGKLIPKYSMQHHIQVSDGNPAHEFSRGAEPSLGANVFESIALSLPVVTKYIPEWDRSYDIEDYFKNGESEIVKLNDHRDFEPLEYTEELTTSNFLNDVSRYAEKLKEDLDLEDAF